MGDWPLVSQSLNLYGVFTLTTPIPQQVQFRIASGDAPRKGGSILSFQPLLDIIL